MRMHLRVPVTDEQKALIDHATADETEGMAAWARAILLGAAQPQAGQKKKRQEGQGISFDICSYLRNTDATDCKRVRTRNCF